MEWTGLPFIFVCGVAITGIGVGLLRSGTTLFGLRVPLAWLHICTGVSLLTLICMPLGVLSGMASDVVLCLLFFRAARSPSAFEGPTAGPHRRSLAEEAGQAP